MAWVKHWFSVMALGGTLLAGTASCVVAPVEPGYVASPPAVVIRPHRHYRPIVTIGTIILIRIATTGRIGPITAGIPTAMDGEVDAAVSPCDPVPHSQGELMNSIIYIVGVVVIVLVILWFFGLR